MVYLCYICDRILSLWQYLTDRNHSSTGEKMETTSGRQLQRILHYSIAPTRSLGLRRTEIVLYDVDCDEVYPRLFIGDA